MKNMIEIKMTNPPVLLLIKIHPNKMKCTGKLEQKVITGQEYRIYINAVEHKRVY